MCQPKWLETVSYNNYRDPALFYGFWGQCFNDYRDTEPHEGYGIVKRWRDKKNNAPNEIADKIRARVKRKVELRRPFDLDGVRELTPYDVQPNAGAFFIFTSNCDGHFYDHFEACEVHDCHGNVELWQCSDRDCYTDNRGATVIWRAPVDYRFVVDKRTMLAPPVVSDEDSSDSDTKSAISDAHVGNDVPRVGHTTGKGQRNP